MKLVGLILFFLTFFSKLQSEGIYNSKSFQLKNGMKVVVVENKRAPVVSQMIWYNFGSGVEEKGKSGLAHFMEHLMFKGTKKFPDNYYSNFISRIGGSENAFTSYDYTAYYQIFPKYELEKIMQMEADRMANLTLTEENVEIEKKVILEERFQRVESDPSAKLDESMRSILFPNHYYGRPIIGWRHEIENLTFSDVLKFYKKHYIPNNAILVLSGDVEFEEVKKISKKYFGRHKKGKVSFGMNTKDPLIETSIKVEMKHPTVKQKIWKKFYRVDSYQKSIKKGLALNIGLKILASGSSSLLYESLVNKKKVFSAVGGYYQGLTKGEGNVYFYAIPNEEINLDEVDNILNDEMKIILDQGITEKRFEIEKKKYIFDFIYSRDGILNPAQAIGESLTIGLPLDDIENLNKKIEEITIFDVKNALKSFQKNKNFIIGGLKN
jgi:zinc protease